MRFVRRRALLRILGGSALVIAMVRGSFSQDRVTTDSAFDRRWMDEAFAMRRLAESWGDQSYGAIVVLNGMRIGDGPSRVVKLRDPDAHAEREAIRDAQRRLGRDDLKGAVLYSTSRPCARCESAAARARISRMIHGADLRDAGPPLE
jgi:tRNA(Arg) A34 adenosine deaminase TadA